MPVPRKNSPAHADETKVALCDLCGSDKALEAPYCRYYTGGYPIHICRNCGFVYVRRRRSAEAIAATWDEIFRARDGKTSYTAAIPAVKARLVYVADTIDSVLSLRGKTVLDIGAGEGLLLEIMRRDYGAKVFGTESSRANCRIMARKKIPHFPGTIEAYEKNALFRPASADIVTITWTLENCASCRDMLKIAHRALKKSGHIAISTGSRLLVPFKKPLQKYIARGPVDTHCFRFSANTLQGLLAVSSFQPEYVNRFQDSDVLCVIGKKRLAGRALKWQKDSYRAVADFFRRWHRESLHYSPA